MSASATLGLDAARAVDPSRYALGGRVPGAALRPATREEVAEMLRVAALERLGVVPWGGGTALTHEPAPERYDVALDLTALDRVVEYDPEDLTLTAECGVTLERLRGELRLRGQELPLESPQADRATFGGVLASNASGPRRLRLGAPHDRILGAHFVLGDGTRARSGGKVVKNVAGFGIHRLLCGSRGGLAVILEASLKLAPAPERRLALIYGADLPRIADRERWAAFPRLEPAALTVLGERAAEALPRAARVAAHFTVIAGFEDDASWVAQQEAATHAALGEPAVRLEADAAVELWQALADAEDRAGPRLTFTSPHHTPDALAPLAGRPGAEALVFHSAAGRLHWFVAENDASHVLNQCAAAGYTLIAARGFAGLEPPVAPQVAVLALRERIRDALDPGHALALGSVWQRGF